MANRQFCFTAVLLCAIASTATQKAQAQGQSILGANVKNYVSATMDGYYAWYERGFNPAEPTIGMPHPGITAALTGSQGTQGPSGTFLMQDYAANNALLLNGLHPAGTLTFSTPTPANAFWLTTDTGFGPAYLNTVTHFADGTPDFTQNFFFQDDWFHSRPNVFNTSGRVDINPHDFNNGTHADPGTFEASGLQIAIQTVIFPNPAVHPVSSIDLSWLYGSVDPIRPSNTAIFGVSVSTNGGAGPFNAVQLTPSSFNQDIVVEAAALPAAGPLPEPGSLLGFGIVALLLSRRRKIGFAKNIVRFHLAEPLEPRLVFSQIFAVTNFTDDPAADGTLRRAIQSAQSGDTIVFPNTPVLSQSLHVITLNSPLEVTTSFNLQGLGAGIISVSGNQTGHVFVIDNNASPTFSGINITQGNNTVDRFGGAVYVDTGASLTLSNVTVSQSNAQYGGGICNFGTLNINNSSFLNNTGTTGAGIANFGTLNISRTVFSGNSASDGGAVYNLTNNQATPAIATIDRTTFQNNTTIRQFGGGGAGISGAGTLILTNSNFFGNVSFEGAAGIQFFGDATIASCIFSGNGGSVGALAVSGNSTVSASTFDGNGGPPTRGSIAALVNSGTLNLVGCTISNNSSTGISNSGTLKLINCTVAQNTTTDTGGGITNTGVLTLRNSTVAGNFASAGGGGISTTAGSVVLYNSIVAGNTKTDSFFHTPTAGDILGSVIGSFNFIGTGGSGGLVNSVDYNMVGVPQTFLAPLGDYGGPTQTMALLPGALELNTGSIALAIDPSGQQLTTDQRGRTRVAYSSVDLGAYEAQSIQTAPPALTAAPGPDQISLSWTTNGSNGPFAVYRGTSPGGEDATPIASLTGNSYLDATTLDGVTYYYRVAAADASGPSVSSNEISALAIPIGPLVSPDGQSGLILVGDADHQHVNWTFGGNSGQFALIDPNPITVVGNPTLTTIYFDDSNGQMLPKTLRLQGTFELQSRNRYVFNGGGVIDIGRSTVYFPYTGTSDDPSTTIRNYLQNGFARGAWNGLGFSNSISIVSSAVASGPPGKYSIGFADSIDNAATGQPANTFEVRFTVTGDANLDGVVDLKDAAILQAHWNAANSPAWDQGNFDYNSTVDVNDALMMARNWNAVATAAAAAGNSALIAPTADPSASSSTAAGLTTPPLSAGTIAAPPNAVQQDLAPPLVSVKPAVVPTPSAKSAINQTAATTHGAASAQLPVSVARNVSPPVDEYGSKNREHRDKHARRR